MNKTTKSYAHQQQQLNLMTLYEALAVESKLKGFQCEFDESPCC